MVIMILNFMIKKKKKKIMIFYNIGYDFDLECDSYFYQSKTLLTECQKSKTEEVLTVI